MKKLFETYWKNYDALYEYVSERVGTSQDCQDIVEDALLCALERRKDFERYTTEEIYNILLKLCREGIQKFITQKVRMLPYDEKYGVRIVKSAADRIELRVDLEKYLLKLDEKDRKIMILYYYFNYDSKCIATICGVSQEAVLQRMSRARRRLKKLIKNHFPI